MTKKCGAPPNRFRTYPENIQPCSRSKGHHGDHSSLYIWPNGQQSWEHWYNYEKHCGQTIGGYTEFRCDRPKGHKVWHKVWINHAKQYLAFKIL